MEIRFAFEFNCSYSLRDIQYSVTSEMNFNSLNLKQIIKIDFVC